MAFPSLYQNRIWDTLYTVSVPDQLTLNNDYVKIFGTHVTDNRKFDNTMITNFTTVKIPVIKILEYYESGVEIRIHSREDMITMHKDIELYLNEWKDYLRLSINVTVQEHKDLIVGLEKLSKYIYEKAKPKEIVNTVMNQKRVGLVNRLQEINLDNREVIKPDYEGIGKLIRQRVKPGGGRF